MAEAPRSELVFPVPVTVPDPGRRVVIGLPEPLPSIGDDFDWLLRDYDGFRIFMMEELSARVPERKRWTPADMEVVLVEALAAALDRLSDMADRAAAEQWLETARRPATVRRLLAMIGYDAAAIAHAAGQIPANDAAMLDRLWRESPHLMDEARVEGPRQVHVQRRAVTLEDYGLLLEQHPLVQQAGAELFWNGMLNEVRIAVLLWRSEWHLATRFQAGSVPPEVAAFHEAREIPGTLAGASIRELLMAHVDDNRMIGQPVRLAGVRRVPVEMSLAIRVRDNFYLSEVRAALDEALGAGPGGFFEPTRLRTGEAVRAGDIYQTVTALEGVEVAALTRLARATVGARDELESGRVAVGRTEIATLARCDLNLRGGRRS